MKKILFALLISLCLLPGVNAETGYYTYQIMERDYVSVSELSQTQREAISGKWIYNDFESFYQVPKNKEIFDKLYTELFERFNSDLENATSNPEYYLSVLITVDDTETLKINSLYMQIKITNNNTGMPATALKIAYVLGEYYSVNHNKLDFNPFSTVFDYIGGFSPFKSNSMFFPTFLFLTNKDTTITGTSNVIELYDSSGELLESYEAGDKLPVLYSTFDIQSNYVTVNLDNYEYVILNLKNYSQKDAFESNLQVKGMVGITPVYEFGTVEKEAVTDRCNISYSDFTDYRFFILKNDLVNTAVYYVKACEEGSAIRFDSTIFNATYITSENKDNPVISFGGVDYNVIPFDKLTTTANSNEENNFVPGASTEFKPFEGVADYISSFWNALTTFMGLVTKFFNTLPIEIRAISITAFTTAITLGVIKFIKS